MKLDTNFIYIAGYAGHGKDTTKMIVTDNYSNVFEDISMAETLKTNATSLINNEFIDITGVSDRLGCLNSLKDNFPERIFYAGLPTRKFLQKLGTEFYRSLYDDIHTGFVALKILNSLEASSDPNLVFMSCDVRFPNELDFMMRLSTLKGEDLKDNLRFILNKIKASLPSIDNIIIHFEKTFNVDRNERDTKLILDDIISNFEILKNTKENLREWNIETTKTAGMSKEEAIKYGLIHIFRPILNPELKYGNLKTKDIVEEVKLYTGLEYGKIADVMKYYKISEIDFNVDNIVKYGYVRADISHPSETSLNGLKPEAILSTPLKNKDFERNLLNVLDVITLKDDLKDDLNVDLKKKNLLNRGI